VRQKQEQLATEVERLRGVLSGLYTKMSAMPKGEASVNLDELAAQMLPEGNVKPLSLGGPSRSSTRWRRDIRTSSPTWTIRPGWPTSTCGAWTWTIRRPSPPASWATRWSRPTARATVVVFAPNKTPSSGADCFVRFAADCSTTFKRYFQDDENTIPALQPLNNKVPSRIVRARTNHGPLAGRVPHRTDRVRKEKITPGCRHRVQRAVGIQGPGACCRDRRPTRSRQ